LADEFKVARMVKKKIGQSFLELISGNIVKQETEAIVNAANKMLAPGGGVAGAIHRAAGYGLWEECKKLGGCKTGEAKLTSGCNLKTKYIIHTVGPVYSGRREDAQDLKNSYFNSLKLAMEHGIKSISFPSISTGVFSYPIKEASFIALKTVLDYLSEHKEINLVRFVLFSAKDLLAYKQSLERIESVDYHNK